MSAPNDERPGQLTDDRPDGVIASATQKLNQVLQNYFAKTAQIVIQSRHHATSSSTRSGVPRRINKWFHIETTESDHLRDELQPWRTLDIGATGSNTIRPLIIEVVLSTRELTANQTLALFEGHGRRYNIGGYGMSRRSIPDRIVLERWVVEFTPDLSTTAIELPIVYKKSIVIFRSLYTLSRLLPAWNLRKRLMKSKLNGHALRLECRLSNGISDIKDGRDVTINENLHPSAATSPAVLSLNPVTTTFGRISTTVYYRENCDFRIEDSEALLSSQFLSNDASLNERRTIGGTFPERRGSTETAATEHRPQSLTTQRIVLQPTARRSEEMRRTASTNREFTDRRPSLAQIQPFKTPSLSASPSLEHLADSSRNMSRTPSLTSVDRVRAQQYPTSRLQQGRAEAASSPLSISPRAPPLTKRYSSSFGQRTSSFTGRRRASQASDSTTPLENSSRSLTQSPAGGQATLSEEGDDLGDFLKLLDARGPLGGSQFREEGVAASRLLEKSSLDKTTHDLARYQQYRHQHSDLEESLIQSSQLLQPSPSASSHASRTRQLAHTPIVPSRLSDNSLPRRQKDSLQDLPRAYSGDVDSTSRVQRHDIQDPWLNESPGDAPFASSAEVLHGLALVDPRVHDESSRAESHEIEEATLTPDLFSTAVSRQNYHDRAAEDDELFFAMSDIHLRS